MNKTHRIFYSLLLAVTALSGFVHMPISKRYGIANVPGLGWTSDYFVSHYVHYISAAILLMVIVYKSFMFLKQKNLSLTISGLVRVIILGVISVSGLMHVISNMKGVNFSARLITAIDFFHLGFAFLFLFVYIPLSVKWKSFTKEQIYP